MAGGSYSHPSFGLGDIARPEVVEALDGIASSEAAIGAAHDKLERLTLLRRSLTMTLSELASLGIDTSALSERIAQMGEAVTAAAEAYVGVRLGQEQRIAELKTTLGELQSTQMPESPVDFEASKLVVRPLGTESLKLDSQYFSFSGNLQEDKLADIEKFVRTSTGSHSDELGRTVCSRISDQAENHHLCGTLILTASCTHRNVQLFSPLVLDPDKAVDAWNALSDNKIDTSDPVLVRQAADDRTDDFIQLVTGAVYASSFVGMAHFVRSDTDTTGDLDALQSQLEKRLRAGGWLANASGGVGIDPAILSEVRGFLSANSVSCHVSIVSQGVAPTIKSHDLTTCAHRLSEVRPEEIALHKAGEHKTVKSDADSARGGALLNSIRNARIGQVLGAVGKSDETKSNILNLNTLIEALENYIALVREKGEVVGDPAAFYLRKLTRARIANAWSEHYAPDPGRKN